MLALALVFAAARPLAVVPVAAAGMSTSEMQELPAVDDAIRSAASRESVAVQPKDQTTAALQSARTAGVACAVADIACWKKVAVLSEVELLLIPVAAPRTDGQVALVVTLVDVAGAKPGRVADVVPKGRDPEGKIKKLVDDVFARAAEAPEPDDSPQEPTATTATTAATTATTATTTATTSTTATPSDGAPSPPASAAPPSTSAGFDLAAIPSWGLGAGAAGAGVVVGAVIGIAAALVVAAAPPHKPQLAGPPVAASSGPAVVQLP